MLHPGEVLNARRGHLQLPDARLPDGTDDEFLHIGDPKTRRFARHQHTRIDDPVVVAALRAVFGELLPAEHLLDVPASGFRRRWDAICECPGLNHSRPYGLTPACLRGSGATHLYKDRVSIPDIAWMGRWRQIRNLEFALDWVFHGGVAQAPGTTCLGICDSREYGAKSA